MGIDWEKLTDEERAKWRQNVEPELLKRLSEKTGKDYASRDPWETWPVQGGKSEQ